MEKAERFMSAGTRAFEAGEYETAVSRAYYAAYHSVIVLFEARIGGARSRWSHNFRPYFDRIPELEELRLPIADLYVARTKADYEETTFAESAVRVLLQSARQALVRAGEVVRNGQI